MIPYGLLKYSEFLMNAGELTKIDLSVSLPELRAHLSTSFMDITALLDQVLEVHSRNRTEEIQANDLMNQPRRQIDLAPRPGTSTAPNTADQTKCPCGNRYLKKCVNRRCGLCCSGCRQHKKVDPKMV
jgi:hypothetical protein